MYLALSRLQLAGAFAVLMLSRYESAHTRTLLSQTCSRRRASIFSASVVSTCIIHALSDRIQY
jgi:hypothetical protein